MNAPETLPVRVVFDTAPGQYNHWKLGFDGPVATLTLDIAEDKGLVPGYKLKLNSYDLGVDIELHDALNRIRFERKALARVLQQAPRAVIATGGSLVNDPDTYNLLLDHCTCVWLKATPEEHMQRVMAQGDLRPFKGSPAALEEIRRLLADRGRLYARADAVVDTTHRTQKQSLAELRALAAKEDA